HGARKDAFQRLIDRALGWLFKPFNRMFARASTGYVGGIGRLLGKSGAALALYGGLLVLTVFTFIHTPTGFVPQQDKLYLVTVINLPDAATIDRTEAVVRRIDEIALKTPGVSH